MQTLTHSLTHSLIHTHRHSHEPEARAAQTLPFLPSSGWTKCGQQKTNRAQQTKNFAFRLFSALAAPHHINLHKSGESVCYVMICFLVSVFGTKKNTSLHFTPSSPKMRTNQIIIIEEKYFQGWDRKRSRKALWPCSVYFLIFLYVPFLDEQRWQNCPSPKCGSVLEIAMHTGQEKYWKLKLSKEAQDRTCWFQRDPGTTLDEGLCGGTGTMLSGRSNSLATGLGVRTAEPRDCVNIGCILKLNTKGQKND